MADIDARRDLLEPLRQRIFNDLKVAGVARVSSFLRSSARAAVDVLHSYVTSDGQGREPPKSPGAVVVQPRGDGYGVAFDLAAGDLGVVVAADSGWQQQWNGGASELPPSGQRHTYGAAALFPGGRREGDPQPNAAGSMRVGAEDGSASVDLTRTRAGVLGSVVVAAAGVASSVRLGSSAASLTLAYQAQTKAVLNAIAAIINAEVAFWNGYVPVTADGIAQKTFWTTTITPQVAALTAALLAMTGTSKTVAE